MSAREFLPNSKYQFKMMLVISLIAFLILVGMGIVSALIGIDDTGAGLVVMAITVAGDAIFWVVAMLISVPYFRSLRYRQPGYLRPLVLQTGFTHHPNCRDEWAIRSRGKPGWLGKCPGSLRSRGH